MTRSSNTYPDVPGQGLYFSGELDTLLLQLLPFLHIAAQLQFLFSRLIHRTFQHLDLILLVLDQLTFQLYLAGGCKKKRRIITIVQWTGFTSDVLTHQADFGLLRSTLRRSCYGARWFLVIISVSKHKLLC